MSHTYNPSYNLSNVAIVSGSGPYSVGTGITISDMTWATTAALNPPSGKIQLDGKDADIVVNGQSLNETLQTIRDQLLIPTVVVRDPKLEQEFAELQALGEEYQKKLDHYREQMRIFKTLKTQDL